MAAFHDILRKGGAFDISVDYYNEKEADLLAGVHGNSTLKKIAGTTLSIPAAEFLTYCLFVNKRDSVTGLQSYTAIQSGLNDRLGDFNDGLELTRTSLRTKLTGNEQLGGLSEKLGVGIALSVLNRIHNLCEADWERIPIGQKKAPDFKIGCNGSGYVQVEAKGSSVSDNTHGKSGTISEHARNIRAKKASLRLNANASNRVTSYGTIGVIDARPESVMKCWLLDPPSNLPRREAKQQQVLNRLHFIAEIMEAALPQSLFTVELYKRLSVLASAEDVLSYNGDHMSGTLASREQALIFNHTYDVGRQFSGVVIPLKDGSRFFYGLRKELIQVAHSQDFARLVELEWQPETKTTSLFMAEPAVEGKTSGTSEGNTKGKSKKPKVEIAQIHTTSSGRVFGLLDAKHE